MRREKLLTGKLILFFVSLLFLILSACSNNPDSSESETDGSGRVSLSIRWLNSTNQEMAVLNPDGTLNCAESGIVRIHAEIYDAEDLFLADSGADGWDCEHHSGLIEGVSSGTGYKLVIYGKDEQGNILYRGEQANITVVEGQTTPLEKVEAFSFVTELLEPAHQETVTNGAFTLHWSDTPGATQYRVLISPNRDLSSPVIDTVTTATTFSPTGLVTDFIYYWGVSVMDQWGNEGLPTDPFILIIKTGVNFPPEMEAIGNKAIPEGEILIIAVRASDPDGDSLVFSTGNLPDGARFDPATGQFVWTPYYHQGGRSYPDILFRVTDNGTPAMSDSETITITVGDIGVNHPPELNQIGSKTVLENSTLQFTISAADPDVGSDDGITYAAGNLPEGAVFDPLTRIFSWTPGYKQSGSYRNVLFTATDDGTPPMSDSEAITITVGNVNRPPVLAEIGNQNAIEGVELELIITGKDPDGDSLTYTAVSEGADALPSGWDFDADTQRFSWTPGFEEDGNYQVTFAVTDSGSPRYEDAKTITISVGDVNRSPVLSPIGNKTVNEGSTLSFTITATDPEGDSLSYSAANLPAGASFNPVSQRFTWTPGYDMAGSYNNVRFTVTDDGVPSLSESRSIAITVVNVNRPPNLNPIGDRTVGEGTEISFAITAADPDGGSLTYSATGLPAGASFNTATQVFRWIPSFDASGEYDIGFTVADSGSPSLKDSETITITVVNQNGQPELEPIGDKTISENSTLSFTILAVDPDDKDKLTYAATSDELPSGWKFDAGKRKFTWTPDSDDSGSYDVTFTVTDDGKPSRSDSETITITVLNVNNSPVLSSIGDKMLNENETLSFTLSATDPDGDDLTYSATGLPSGASLNPSTGVFNWATDYG
ncbi:MAG: tandem-95 repeat protein, partial [Desulfobacteraceae bacterium]